MTHATSPDEMSGSREYTDVFNLRRLPQELQDIITEYVVNGREPIECRAHGDKRTGYHSQSNHHSHASTSEPQTTSCVLVDTKANREATQTFWHSNTFIFSYGFEATFRGDREYQWGARAPTYKHAVKEVISTWMESRKLLSPARTQMKSIQIQAINELYGHVLGCDMELRQTVDSSITFTPVTALMNSECLCALREAAARFHARTRGPGYLLSFCAEMEEAGVIHRWMKGPYANGHDGILGEASLQCSLRRSDGVGLGVCLLQEMDLYEDIGRLFGGGA